MNLRSPMSVALGKGAAGGAAQHWWVQRATAVALVPLTLWFVFSLLALPAMDFDSLRSWLGSGWTPIWMSLFIVCSAWHSALGMQVVIEDYITGGGAKTAALLLANFVHAASAAAALFAVLKVAVQR